MLFAKIARRMRFRDPQLVTSVCRTEDFLRMLRTQLVEFDQQLILGIRPAVAIA